MTMDKHIFAILTQDGIDYYAETPELAQRHIAELKMEYACDSWAVTVPFELAECFELALIDAAPGRPMTSRRARRILAMLVDGHELDKVIPAT